MGGRDISWTVVIVHWNQAEACVETVARFVAQGHGPTVIVVDNGSEESQLDHLRRHLPACVDLVEAGTNLGFGPGANVGLRQWLDHGTTEWALLAPHDAEPLPGCLEGLAEALQGRPMAGLVCADVGDGQTPMIDPYFGGVTRPGDPRPGWQPADYPHGTLMALRRGCLQEIGLFDERFFSYCEEADLGRRATEAGWQVGLVRGARVRNTHLGTSVPAVDYLQERNTLLFVSEMSGTYKTFIRLCISAWQLLRGVLRPASRPPVFDARARLLGIWHFLIRRFGPPPPALYERR